MKASVLKASVLKVSLLKTALLNKRTSTAIVVPGLVLFSSVAMAHNEETASSVVATLVHQLASPDHLLALAGALGLAAAAVMYGPSVYRRIRQGKKETNER